MLLTITGALIGVFTSSYTTIEHVITAYGYAAIFGLMLMEGASIPVPSEVILPIAGLLAQKGLINVYFAFVAALLGSIGGMIIDYYIGYFLGKEVVYKHMGWFHISRHSLDRFDDWFARNGVAAVFVARLIPLVGTWMSFPAGFARMDVKKFFPWAIAGASIWDATLLIFGYFFLSADKAVYVLLAIAVFAVAVYLIYHLSTKRMGRKR